MIEDFVNSAIIIDDREDEVAELKKLLDEKQIYSSHILPEKLIETKLKLKNRKLIFLDLFVNEGQSLTNQIALIRKIFKVSVGNDFGAYGIVLWTKHPEHLEEFKEKFYKSYNYYDLPLFIVSLPKTEYLKNGFNKVFTDLNEILFKNPASNFFINWEVAVSKSKDHSIRQIYDLVNANQNENLSYILFHMARNFTGIPYEHLAGYDLEHDAIKAFSDLLTANINNYPKVNHGLFSNWEDIKYSGKQEKTKSFRYDVKNVIPQNSDKKNILKEGEILSKKEKKKDYSENIEILEKEIIDIQSRVNKELLFDNTNLDRTKVFPGAIYKIKDKDSPFILPNKPAGSVDVALEITPPCDFSQSKYVRRRLIGGFYIDYDKNILQHFQADSYYTEIWPVNLDDKVKIMIFDFRVFGSLDESLLRRADKYDLFLRSKEKLFADVLQKLSSHTARLGLSVLH